VHDAKPIDLSDWQLDPGIHDPSTFFCLRKAE
jgi:hypothetical protein